MQLFYYEINTIFDMWEKVYENNTQNTSVKRLLVRDIVWVIKYWKPIFHNKMSLNFSLKVSYNKQQNYIQNNQQKNQLKCVRIVREKITTKTNKTLCEKNK